ncbi:MAG: SPOR domain-containing protein [Bacteroidales bacterium]|nr:SPOR domain-containing protein [Bacteroidales bacterium]
MKKIFVILLCVLSIDCFSQNANVVVQQDSRVEQLIQKQKDIHLADNTIDGYRIQIFMESGNDAVEHANIMMEEFKEKYPDIPIYLVFGQPYYRLRVGDYRTRLEAEKAFLTLNKDYKKAFITGDRIQLPYNVFCDSTYIDNNVIDDDFNIDDIYYDEY